MLYIFMGPSCTGKSTAADKIKELMEVEVFSGKDYMRMAKNENEAWKLFYDRISNAASHKELSKENIIYIITEKEQLNKINTIRGFKQIKFTASLDTIKSRFAQRMRGNLPQPLERMLEKQYAEWKSVTGDITIDTTENNDMAEIARKIENI